MNPMAKKKRTIKPFSHQKIQHYEVITAHALKKVYDSIIEKTVKELRHINEAFGKDKLPNIDAIVTGHAKDIYANIVAGKMLVGKSIISHLEKQLKRTIDLRFFNTQVVPAIESRTFKIVTTEITDTISNQLKEKIYMSMVKGDTIKDISKSLTMLKTNHETVARTEIHSFANQGSFDLMTEELQLLGSTQEARKYWIPSGKPTGRETHIQAGIDYGKGNGIPMGDTFKVGGTALMYPGDYNGTPEEIINCACDYGVEF